MTLAGLERMGLIARVQDPAGGRRHLVELTTAGRDRLEDVRQARVEWPATSVQRLYTEDERRLIIRR